MRSSTDNKFRFRTGSVVFVGPSTDEAVPRKIMSVRPHKGGLVVAFEGIGDRSIAEDLRGETIYAAKGDQPDLGEGSFWDHQLIGLAVVGLDGRELGVIEGIQHREAQDLWEVTTAAGAISLPAAKGIIVEVDLDERRIVVDPPKGLFE